MEQPLRSRSTDQSARDAHSAPFDPFAATYPSDLDAMLAVDNTATTTSWPPSPSFNTGMDPSTMLPNSAYGGVDQYGPFGMSGTSDHITAQQFNEMLTLSEASANIQSAVMTTQGPSTSLQFPQDPQSQAWGRASQDVPRSIPAPNDTLPAGNFATTAQQLDLQHLSPPHGSPANSSSSRPLISPIVRVESYEGPTDPSHLVDPSTQMGRQSSNHLSPFDRSEYESDDDQGSGWHYDLQPLPVQSVQRREDGAWLEGPSGQRGLSPQARDELKDHQTPTLDELVGQRQLLEKNAGVQDWLARSEVGSEAGEVRKESLTPRQKPANRRRAKSTNDMGAFSAPDDSGIPGPGVHLNVPSDYDEDEDPLSASDELESPPAQIELDNGNSYFPALSEDSHASGHVPWVDPPMLQGSNERTYQPPTANAAIMRFKQRAKDVESASLAATLGSTRRRSESDMGSVLTMHATSRDLSAEPKEKPHRVENLLQMIIQRRGSSNQKKRKGTAMATQAPTNANDGSSGTSTPLEPQPQPTVSALQRMGSWGRPKSPKLDTSPDILSPPTMNGNTLNVASPSTIRSMAKNVMRRTRSKSDLGRSRSKSDAGRSPGLGELMTAYGGPPMLKLASPSGPAQVKPSPTSAGVDYDDDSGDDSGGTFGGITMDLAVRDDRVIPTFHGFNAQARELNPRIPYYLLERVSKEQLSRYQRLVAAKQKHATAVKAMKCSSKDFCFDLHGASKQLKPRVGNKDGDTSFQGFQILRGGMTAESVEKESDNTIQAAQFPSGVPLPPVDRLPAEFECPWCFKVKKFYKPSDWTKHVHEDVQPFTCTFSGCTEPKSFKRKADWVRHENERHRQLEYWTCDIGDCRHTCYRKDNFVQHLVREHKIPEPKARTAKGLAANPKSPISPLSTRNWVDPYVALANPAGYGAEDVWMIVDRCKHDTTKLPQEEPCRFCGNICNSWKKLTVHLAKHMEQISMPILPLIEAKHCDSAAEPVQLPVPQGQRSTGALTDSPQNLPVTYTDEPLRLDLNDAISHGSITPGISVNGSSVMQTYPPPQYLNPQYRAPVAPTPFGALPLDTSYSYPGPMPTSRQHTPSGQGSYSSSVQGSGLAPHRSVAGGHPQQAYHSPAQSNTFSDDTLSAVDAAFMLSSGQVSASPSPGPASQTGAQANGTFHSGFDQTFTFPSQQYSAYSFSGTSG